MGLIDRLEAKRREFHDYCSHGEIDTRLIVDAREMRDLLDEVIVSLRFRKLDRQMTNAIGDQGMLRGVR